MTKPELRKTYLSRRSSISEPDRAQYSRLIASQFFTSVLPPHSRVIHCFVSIEKFKEVDTQPIFAKIWASFPQITTVVPRVDFESGLMSAVTFGPEQVLGRNHWGIDEPTHDEIIPPAEIDVVIVPLLAYDRIGHRVGYGKGFYDRFLADCRGDCLKVGVSYFPPVDEIEGSHEQDIPLDVCITPTQLYFFVETK